MNGTKLSDFHIFFLIQAISYALTGFISNFLIFREVCFSICSFSFIAGPSSMLLNSADFIFIFWITSIYDNETFIKSLLETFIIRRFFIIRPLISPYQFFIAYTTLILIALYTESQIKSKLSDIFIFVKLAITA